jgi:hypothetical protein
MLFEVLKDHFESAQFAVVHCLDDKLRIVGEEHKAAAFPLGLSCFLYCLNVLVRVKRLLNLVRVDFVVLADLAEYASAKIIDNNILINPLRGRFAL